MTYPVVYIDGDHTMFLQFEDSEWFHAWEECMDAIKAEAARIVASIHDVHNLSVSNVAAIRIWIQTVDAVVEVGQDVLPSILSARNSFAQTIGN
eukprot:scaffold179330_cov33-Attheya_sp.AAC.2